MMIVYIFPTRCELSRTEGFQVDTKEIQTTCPRGSRPFINETGQTLCCKGTVNGRTCEGKLLCSFSEVPGSQRIPICSRRKTKYTGPIDSWIQTLLGSNPFMGFKKIVDTMKQSNKTLQQYSEAELSSSAKAQISGLVQEENQWLIDFQQELNDYDLAPESLDLQQEAMYIYTRLQSILSSTGIGSDPSARLLAIQEIMMGPRPKAAPYKSPQWKQMPGALKQVQQDGNVVCGVNSSDNIYCADQNIYSSPNWFQLPGALKHISVSGQRVCGTNANDDIYCAENYRSPQWKQIPGKLKQIDIEGTAACGVNANDDIYCADTIMNPSWRNIPGKLKHITLSKGKIYGVNSSDNIYYGGRKDAVSWKQIPGGLKQVDMDGSIVCGVNKFDNIYCKDDLESGNWRQLPGSLKYVSVNNEKLYGVNASDNIYSASS